MLENKFKGKNLYLTTEEGSALAMMLMHNATNAKTLLIRRKLR